MPVRCSPSGFTYRRPEALTTSRRMTFPDGLRAIAALLVILPHSAGLFAYWPVPSLPTRLMMGLASCGHVGVQIFFVLSGFVIAYTLRRQMMTLKSVVVFIVRRSIRLDPPYWAAIALFCAYLSFRRSVALADVAAPSSQQLVSHLFYLQDVFGYGDINVAFWTLCIEVQFYLVFCIVLGISQTLDGLKSEMGWAWDKIPFITLYVLSLAWPARFLGDDTPAAGLFLPHWYAFILGAIVWWVVEGRIPHWVGYLAILLLAAICAMHPRKDVLAVACTASLVLIAANRGRLYRWLDEPWIQFLGKISYSIYLVHVPIAGVILGLQVRIAPRSEVVSFLMLAIVVGASIGVAFVLNRYVEEPSLRLSHRFKMLAALTCAPTNCDRPLSAIEQR